MTKFSKIKFTILSILLAIFLSTATSYADSNLCTTKNVNEILTSIELATTRLDFAAIKSKHNMLLAACNGSTDFSVFRDNLRLKCNANCYLKLVDYYTFIININELFEQRNPNPTTIEELVKNGVDLADDGIRGLMGITRSKTSTNRETPSNDGLEDFDNKDFYNFVNHLARLKLGKARLLMYLGDYHHRMVQSGFNQYLISTTIKDDSDNDILDSFLSRAAVDYNRAQKAVIDAITDIPGSALPKLAGTATDLLNDIEKRMDAITKGYIYPNINPTSISTKRLYDLKTNLKIQIEALKGLELQMANTVKRAADQGVSAATMEQSKDRWFSDKELAIKSSRLSMLNAEISVMKEKASSIYQKLNEFNHNSANASKLIELEKEIEILNQKSLHQINQIKRDETLVTQSHLLADAMDQRSEIRYNMDRVNADTHLTNEILSVEDEIERRKTRIANIEIELETLHGIGENGGSLGILKNELEQLKLEKKTNNLKLAKVTGDIDFNTATLLTSFEREKRLSESRIEILDTLGVKKDKICELQKTIQELMITNDATSLKELTDRNGELKKLYAKEVELAEEAVEINQKQISDLRTLISSFQNHYRTAKNALDVYRTALAAAELKAAAAAAKAALEPNIGSVNFTAGGDVGLIKGAFELKSAVDESSSVATMGWAIAKGKLSFVENQVEFNQRVAELNNSLSGLESQLEKSKLQKAIADFNMALKLIEIGNLKDQQARSLGITKENSKLATMECEANNLNHEVTALNAKEQLEAIETKTFELAHRNLNIQTEEKILRLKGEQIDFNIQNKESEIYNANLEVTKLENSLALEKASIKGIEIRHKNLLDLQTTIGGYAPHMNRVDMAIKKLKEERKGIVQVNSTTQIDELRSVLTNHKEFFKDLKILLRENSSTNKMFNQKLRTLNKSIEAFENEVARDSKNILDNLTFTVEKDRAQDVIGKINFNQELISGMVPTLSQLVDRKRQLLYRANAALAEYVKKVGLGLDNPLKYVGNYRVSAQGLENERDRIESIYSEASEQVKIAEKAFIDLTDSRIHQDLNRFGDVYLTIADLTAPTNPYKIHSTTFDSIHNKRIIDIRFVYQRECNNPSTLPLIITNLGLNLNDSWVGDEMRYNYFITEPLTLGLPIFHVESMDPDRFNSEPEIDLVDSMIGNGRYITSFTSLGDKMDAPKFPWAGRSVNGMWHLAFPLRASDQEKRRRPAKCEDEREAPITGLGVYIWYLGKYNGI